MSQQPFVPLLLGADINVYSMARAFHEAYGVKSIVFGMFAASVCAGSKIIDYRIRQGNDTVEQVLELEPEHLSCYGLKVEEGTPLFAMKDTAGLPGDEEQADMYLQTVEFLKQYGYEQYEISNFAKPGFQSRHNLKYWMGRPYIGFGPGAHSDFGGRRYSFVRDLDKYISGVLGGGVVIDESELIPQRERGSEYLMLRLRTTRGIEEWEYRREFFMNFDPIEQKLEEYERQGWTERHDRRWNLTPKGFLVSNQLIGELLAIQEEATLEKTLPRLKQGRPESEQER